MRIFESGEVPPDGFHHADHVRVVWWYLRQHELPEALRVFADALKRFALGRLYVTAVPPDTLICLDLASEKELWRKTLGKYADSHAFGGGVRLKPSSF